MQHALEEARDKHMAYITEMENTVAEREKQLSQAHEKHLAEQNKLLRSRSGELKASIDETRAREEDLKVELQNDNGLSKKQTMALKKQLAAANQERTRTENQLKLVKENNVEVMQQMEETFFQQKEELNDRRTNLEESFRKKEKEYAERFFYRGFSISSADVFVSVQGWGVCLRFFL